jgi:hypothetical protein
MVVVSKWVDVTSTRRRLTTAINSRSEIAGFEVTSAGEVHAFLATPKASDCR